MGMPEFKMKNEEKVEARKLRLLLINGERCEIQAADLESLFVELGLPAPLLLVEYNGKALHRSEWDEVKLNDGDRLEIMAVAAGG